MILMSHLALTLRKFDFETPDDNSDFEVMLGEEE
jgi:hypothetical protein